MLCVVERELVRQQNLVVVVVKSDQASESGTSVALVVADPVVGRLSLASHLDSLGQP